MSQSQLFPWAKSFFQWSTTKSEKRCCVTAAFVSSRPVLLMSVICTCFWRPLQHQLRVMFVPGLLSQVEKQLGVNKGKQSAYTWGWDRSRWHWIALKKKKCFWSPSPSVDCFKVRWYHRLTNNIWGSARLQREQINVCYSAYKQNLSFSDSSVFLFLFPQCSHHTLKSNKDDWLHFVTAEFIFEKDLQVQPDVKKAEI